MEMQDYRQIMAGRDKLLEVLNKNDGRKWGNVAGIAIVFPDSIHVSPNQACHAGLSNNYDGNKEKGSIAVVSGLMKPSNGVVDEEEAHYFLDWLLNRSVYAPTFITKSADEALYTKTIISSSFHPSNLMAGGLVASRHLWEHAQLGRVFVDLAKAGVNEDLAFYLSHLFSGRFDRGGNCSFGTVHNGHCPMDPGVMGKAELKNYLEHKPQRLNKTYHENYVYHGYDAMFGESRRNGYYTELHKKFPYQGGVDKVAEAANPFAAAKKADPAKAACSYDDLIKKAAEFQHTIFQDIGFNQERKAA